MKLDLRIPIGCMFAVFGVILTIWGIVSPDLIYARSLGINVNLWWGLVLLVFGLVMLGVAVRLVRRSRQLEPGRHPPTV